MNSKITFYLDLDHERKKQIKTRILPIEFFDSEHWLDACVEYGFALSEIKESNKEYWFEIDGVKLAYWDRKHQIGFIMYKD